MVDHGVAHDAELCVLVRAMGVVSRPDSSISSGGKLAVPVRAEPPAHMAFSHDIPGGEDNGDARTAIPLAGAGPVLDDGGMPHAPLTSVTALYSPQGDQIVARCLLIL